MESESRKTALRTVLLSLTADQKLTEKAVQAMCKQYADDLKVLNDKVTQGSYLYSLSESKV